MDDYSHCHYWDNKRLCISFECDTCDYKREYFRVNATCFSARRLGYDGDSDCENCTLCSHQTCVFDSKPCTQCEDCFEDFGMVKCESCINFGPEIVFWVKCRDCDYKRKEGYVRIQRYWNEDELDEDLFKL